MSEALKQALGLTVRQVRRRAGLTQEELAARIGRTPETVSNIERGRQLPALDTLVDLARALGVPASQLVADVLADVLGDAPGDGAGPGTGSDAGSRPRGQGRGVSRRRAQLEVRLREVGRALDERDLAVAVAQAEVLLRLSSAGAHEKTRYQDGRPDRAAY